MLKVCHLGVHSQREHSLIIVELRFFEPPKENANWSEKSGSSRNQIGGKMSVGLSEGKRLFARVIGKFKSALSKK